MEILVLSKIANFAQNFLNMAKTKKTTAKQVTPKKGVKSAPKKVVKPAAKKAVKSAAPKKVAKPAPKKAVAKPVAKKSAKPAPKKVVKPVAKKVAKPAPKKAVKPVVKKVAKPAPKKVVKPVAKKVTKPTPKKVTAKSAAKKVAKPAPKKVVKAVKPIAKKAVKPIAKKAVKPVVKKSAPVSAKKAVKPAPKPIVKKVVVPTKPIVKKAEIKPIALKEKAVKAAPVLATKSKKEVVEKLPKVKLPKPKKVIKEELPAKALIFLKKPEVKEETPAYNKPTQLRYSDEDLREFKGIVDKKLESAREELVNLKSSLENHTDSQEGNKAWNLEEGSDTSEMEYLMNQISRQNKFIRDLEMALVRVENKTYGICRVTGKLIDKNRLRIVPHATLSIEAKQSRKGDDHTTPNTSNSAHMGSEGEGFGTDDHR